MPSLPQGRLLSRLLSALLFGTVLAGAIRAEGGKFNVVETTVSDVHAAYKAHRLTAHQLVQLYLDRIAAYDQKGPAINCIITINPHALEDADKLDAAYAKTGKFVGPMHGIPILVKDEIDVGGLPTTLGTVEFKDYIPPLDAFPVAKLRAEGAIILGKTTLSEFAAGDAYGSMFGVSHNPYDLTRTVGGSSGGSGGSLAANFSTLAIGEETSSSLRRPAAWTCLAALRPTPGLISRTGMWDGAPVPIAQMGPMARSVTDLAKMLDGMVGYDPADPITALGVRHIPKTYTVFLDKNGLRGARIGVLRDPLSPNSDPTADDFQRVDALFVKAIADLKANGATVMDVVIPDLKLLMSKAVSDPAAHEAALEHYLSRNPNSKFHSQADIDNDPEMKNSFRYKTGGAMGSFGGRNGGGRVRKPVDAAAILADAEAREKLLMNIAQVMADHHLDALAYKATEHEPNKTEEATNPPYKPTRGVVSINTFVIYSSTICVPMGFSDGHIPAGLAFFGLPYEEPTLIKLAYAYEQATHHRQPPALTPELN